MFSLGSDNSRDCAFLLFKSLHLCTAVNRDAVLLEVSGEFLEKLLGIDVAILLVKDCAQRFAL